MLCSYCQKVLQTAHIPLPSGSYPFRRSGPDVLASVKDDCYACSLFWSVSLPEYKAGIQNGVIDSATQKPKYNAAYHIIAGITRTSFLAIWPDPVVEPWHTAVQFSVIPLKDLSVPKLKVAISTNTGSDKSLNYVRNWVDRCISTHSTCRKPLTVRSAFPSRLLVLSPETGTVKVEDTRNIDPNQQYVALSYCWGSYRAITLTSETSVSLFKGFPITSLPQSYIDIFYTASKLGMRYVWIDSLCIIQDSIDDWRNESAHMSEIYQNAYCTIAATASADSNGGCFRERNPCLVEHTTVTIPLRRDSSVWKDHECLVFSRWTWTSSVSKAVLNSRAWVVQERLLSPRLVHFSDHQIFWECAELEACESFPRGFPRLLRETAMGFKLPDKVTSQEPQRQLSSHDLKTKDDRGDRKDRAQSYQLWDHLVNVYTKCNLTQSADKLIAMSGMAKVFSDKLQDQYLAGLWRSRVEYYLAWAVDFEQTLVEKNRLRPQVWRAPTWSWASVEGEISFAGPQGATYNSLIDIIDCEVVPIGKSVFGQLKKGSMIARGMLTPIEWTRWWRPGRQWDGFDPPLRLQIKGEPLIRSVLFPDELHELPTKNLFALPLIEYEYDNNGQTECQQRGLLLSETESSTGNYKRLGLYTLRSTCREDADMMKMTSEKKASFVLL